VHDAYNRGVWDGALKFAAPNFVLDDSRALGEWSGIYTGTEKLRSVWEWRADLWESLQIEIDETIVAGEQVVVPHTMHFRGRDGIEVRARTTWLFALRDGKIERLCLYQDKQHALEAAGPRE
jgi:ketosteroid isomerase-like protein